MEAIRQITRTPKNHVIRVNLPPHIPENEPVEIIVIVGTQEPEIVECIQEQTGVQQHVSQTLLEDVDEQTRAFLAFSGTWEDERPVEEIIRDIYESRTLGREEVIL